MVSFIFPVGSKGTRVQYGPNSSNLWGLLFLELMQISVHFNLEIPIPKTNESRGNMKIRVMDHTRDECVFAMFPPGVGGRVD